MALIPRFNINKILVERLERIDQVILEQLQFIGETFVKNARLNGDYDDQTGNLRSSIGYVILKNGEQIDENFETVPPKNVGKKSKNKVSGDKKGDQVAREVIYEIAQRFSSVQGYVLIVVAGMEYAAAVEAKGRDVLTASSITAKNDLKIAIEALKGKIKLMQ